MLNRLGQSSKETAKVLKARLAQHIIKIQNSYVVNGIDREEIQVDQDHIFERISPLPGETCSLLHHHHIEVSSN